MSKFLLKGTFNWIDSKDFNSKKYTNNSSKGYVLKVDLEYPKELRELHSDYPLSPDKTESKKKNMLSKYSLMISDFYNIPIGKVKGISDELFLKKYGLHYESLELYLRLGLKLKILHHVLQVNQLQWLKPYVEFNTQKKIEAERNYDKDG